jgi:hypothetical protein
MTVRGKCYRRILQEGAKVLVPELDVAKAFRDSSAVNAATHNALSPTDPCDTPRTSQPPCRGARISANDRRRMKRTDIYMDDAMHALAEGDRGTVEGSKRTSDDRGAREADAARHTVDTPPSELTGASSTPGRGLPMLTP